DPGAPFNFLSLASSFSHTLPDFSLPSLACSAPAPRFLCFITRGGHRYWRQSRVQAAQGDGHQPELAPAAPQRCSRDAPQPPLPLTFLTVIYLFFFFLLWLLLL
uniref:Uncharacterized protein n=1 Tax=Anser cygnoides TaxID=8845 RepID=A0A8B9IIF6_ANSCY